MSISQRIKELLVAKNLSQKEMAIILKVDASQFSKIISGKLQPTLVQLMEISSFFNSRIGCSAHIFVGIKISEGVKKLNTGDAIICSSP